MKNKNSITRKIRHKFAGAIHILIPFGMITVICLAAFAISMATSFNDTEYVVTITEKERVVTSESSKYLVFAETEQGEIVVFQNTDNFIRGKFDSSNFQGRLKVGNTYRLTVVGYRIPILSSYQNIIEINSVE